ncbi:shikimate kinase [uncultured Methanomethylovorans sp.]|uniref:shikimate kinase n=1 Tax=uncultured Methanomethylovorans sp. TaxID=183759 RepID=UPI002AA8D1F2|nr:shikimate kinase [uncultured Methanomethylovorans sp.]
MSYTGHAYALGAGTIVNAIATWKGSAFAVDLKTFADIELYDGKGDITGTIEGIPDADTRLIKRTAELVLQYFNVDMHGSVKTKSEIPLASGLKSSSAAANATVLATLDALGEEMDPLDAVKIGVQAALEVGVSITGAFDDACASFFGGIVVTDNKLKELEHREEKEKDVLIFAPDKKSFSATTNVARSQAIAPWVDMAYKLALEGNYEEAMTLNGFLYCGALGFETEPMMLALEAGVKGVTLSGTGPSYVALVDTASGSKLKESWSGLEISGSLISTKIYNKKAKKLAGCDHK